MQGRADPYQEMTLMAVYRDTRRKPHRWRYRASITLPDGTSSRISGCAPRQINTKEAAEQAEREHIVKLTRPELVPPAMKEEEPSQSDVPTLATFADEFLSTYVKSNNKPSEQKSKKQILEGHLLPALGRRRLDQIGPREIEALKAELLDGERSRKTVNNVLAVLSKVLHYAEEIGLIGKAPKVKLLKVEKQRFRFLDFDEYDALVAAAKDFPEWLAAILLAGDAGLRMGELRALRWDHWDRRGDRITVERAFWTDVEGATKGWNQRTIPLTKRLAAALRAIRHLRGPYVLCDEDGKPRTIETVVWHLRRLRRKAGLAETGWHSLRHTFCSHLAMRGAPALTIQALAGHASLATTDRYMHLVPGATDAAIALLDRPANLLPTSAAEDGAGPATG